MRPARLATRVRQVRVAVPARSQRSEVAWASAERRRRMTQILDLAAIAEQVEVPYHCIPVAHLGSAEVSLFICQGARSWHRRLARPHMLIVTEGVITVDCASGKTIVGEGEVVSVPAEVAYNTYSGMRSTVLSIENLGTTGRDNGHETLAPPGRASVTKVSAAVTARKAPEFAWLPCGAAGSTVAAASRLRGSSGFYVVPSGSLLLAVYRGVLDYRSGEEEGTVVGNQLLLVNSGEDLTLRSGHGATVMAIVARGVPLPAPAAAGPEPRQGQRSDPPPGE